MNLHDEKRSIIIDRIKSAIIPGFLIFIFFSINSFSQSSKWFAPATADNLINPLKDNPSSITEGKKTFQSMCSMCHGEKGKGSGASGAFEHLK